MKDNPLLIRRVEAVFLIAIPLRMTTDEMSSNPVVQKSLPLVSGLTKAHIFRAEDPCSHHHSSSKDASCEVLGRPLSSVARPHLAIPISPATRSRSRGCTSPNNNGPALPALSSPLSPASPRPSRTPLPPIPPATPGSPTCVCSEM